MKEEVKEINEQEVEIKKKKEKKPRKFSIFGLIINIIAFSVVLLFICIVYFSYNNFNLVKDGKEPNGYKSVEKYEKDGRKVVVYDYVVYKIESVKYSGMETYTLKPFFIDNY